jgi:long-subunit fatty acid transport protein
MKQWNHWKTAALSLLVLTGSTGRAAVLDRSGQGLGALFEEGRYMEVSLAQVMPSVKGRDVQGGATGNVGGDHLLPSASVKFDANERLSFAFVADQPYGAKLHYDDSSRLLGGTSVDETSYSVLSLARYRLTDRFSIHGGVRVQSSSATVHLQGLAYGAVNGYQVRFSTDTAAGAVAGMAYEVPDIALRVVATYHDAITHQLDTRETAPLAALNGSSRTSITMPRAVNLDFQTGVATDTLLFGQLRWVNWSEFHVAPARFFAVVGDGLVNVTDSRTWTLGLARRFSPHWSGAFSLSYEASNDGFSSSLSPVNGRKGMTLAAIYGVDKMKVTVGLNYTQLGDARLATGTPGTERALMSGNSSLGLGLKVGWSF